MDLLNIFRITKLNHISKKKSRFENILKENYSKAMKDKFSNSIYPINISIIVHENKL